MLQNFFKITLRNLLRNKTYSFLNIFGLAIGIACAGLIFLWVEDEVNYDSGNLKKNQLYKVMENEILSDKIATHSSTPGPMAPVMKSEITGINNTCRSTEGAAPLLFTIGDRPVYASGYYVDSSLFSMFTLPFVQGNINNAFKELYSIVITQKTAKKFFGEEKNVVGKTVRLNNQQNYVVTGVIKDLPENSTLQFEWVAPFEIFFKNNDYITKWSNNSLTTYVELNQNTSPANVNNQLADYLKKRDPKTNIKLSLFNMNDWHLHGEFENGKQTGGGQIQYVRLFSIIAWIILFIACINFMNLATARSEKRAREVGVRKVMGAGKGNLIIQFIGEALFMSLLATAGAVILMSLALPSFNMLVQKNLSLNFNIPSHSIALLLITLICGLIAGSYPSLYLSSFNPVSVLKGLKIKTGSASIIRKGLVVLQFSISIVLIIATLIIYQQIQHVKTRTLGFNKDNLLVMDLQGNMGKNFEAIRNDLMNTNAVEDAALSDHSTLYGGNNTDGFTWQGKDPNTRIVISNRYVSPEFLKTSGIKILEGRGIQEGDTMYNRRINVVITASLAKMMGSGSAISKSIWFDGDTSAKTNVVGVVNDFVYGNMYGKPDPVMFFYGPVQNATVMYMRIKEQTNPADAIAKIETVIKKDNPGYPFEYKFVDDQFNAMFMNEMLISKLSRVFATLAIIISCLGLFGLAAYTAERRTKEIGVRKVLGASVSGIAALLSKDFVKLVCISCLVAFPLSWWAMHNWLMNYEYRIDISWWIFFAAGIVAILIALITVSFQAIKAAVANPVKSLRTE
jgi:putative ABC transport system permease protein